MTSNAWIVSTVTSYCSDFRSVLACWTLCWGHSWPIGCNKSHSMVSYPVSSCFCSVFCRVPYWGCRCYTFCTMLSLNSWSCVMVCKSTSTPTTVKFTWACQSARYRQPFTASLSASTMSTSGCEPADCSWTRPKLRSCGSAPASSWSMSTSTTSCYCRPPSRLLRARETLELCSIAVDTISACHSALLV